MDFKNAKDQFQQKAKDELSGKINEVKDDVSKKFGLGNKSTDAAAPQNETAELNENTLNDARNTDRSPIASEPESIDEAETEREPVEAQGEIPSTEAGDEAEEEAA